MVLKKIWNFNYFRPHSGEQLQINQSVHKASEIGEFSIYYVEFSGECSVACDYFLFRRRASFKIFSCNITPFSCY